jgi:putative ABC transport system permease protein
MDPGALDAVGAHLLTGRFYDAGADPQKQMVAVLGVDAAQELGISSTVGAPAIFVGDVALTVVGIVNSTQQESEILYGVVVPPYAASVIAGSTNTRDVIARTAPGAAQLIGAQGPYALNPYLPQRITAEVPPAPSTLRAQVEASLGALLTVLGLAGLAIGTLSIAAVTVLSVNQRQSELGSDAPLATNGVTSRA